MAAKKALRRHFLKGHAHRKNPDSNQAIVQRKALLKQRLKPALSPFSLKVPRALILENLFPARACSRTLNSTTSVLNRQKLLRCHLPEARVHPQAGLQLPHRARMDLLDTNHKNTRAFCARASPYLRVNHGIPAPTQLKRN